MPAQPTQAPAPLRAADFNGQEMAKGTTPHTFVVLFGPAVRPGLYSLGHADSELSATVALYTFTHAFLI